MILNRSSRMNETMNDMTHQGANGARKALQATFGKVGLATQQDFAGMSSRKSPNNLKSGNNNLMGNTKDSQQKLPMLIR